MTLKALQGREPPWPTSQVLNTVATAAATGAGSTRLRRRRRAAQRRGRNGCGARRPCRRIASAAADDRPGREPARGAAKKALADIEKMEDTFFAALQKPPTAAGVARGPVGGGAAGDARQGHGHRRPGGATLAAREREEEPARRPRARHARVRRCSTAIRRSSAAC